MATDRLETLKTMVAQSPDNQLARYGLAMEYKNQGDFTQAIAEFHSLLAAHPNYAAAYFHGGQALEKAGRIEEARAMYQRGIDVTTRIGDAHTRSELEAALAIC